MAEPAQRAVVINPAKICQPIGAMYATLGINQAVPLVQGSQGCSTYVRYQFNRHFREPVNIAVTSFHEDAAVFGGRKNLIEGLYNLVLRYRPRVIGVVTTCSSETIGDDIETFVKEARKEIGRGLGEDILAQVSIVPIHTPSYAGSHVKGYDTASKAYLEYLAAPGQPNGRLNIIPGIINPGDIEEIKHLVREMGVDPLVIFDISDTLNAPMRLPKPLYPEGGTTAEELKDCANSQGTVALCRHAGGSGAQYLLRKFNLPAVLGPLPVGVANTDTFLENVQKITGAVIPPSVERERGILLDHMADTSQYTVMRRAAIFGDPDIVSAVTRVVCELGMEPVVVLSGTASKDFTAEVAGVTAEYGVTPDILSGSDLFAFEQLARERKAEVILGHSKGVDMAKDMRVPLVRVGFPVYDRVGLFRRPIVGYRGTLELMDRIINSILDFAYPEDKLHQ